MSLCVCGSGHSNPKTPNPKTLNPLFQKSLRSNLHAKCWSKDPLRPGLILSESSFAWLRLSLSRKGPSCREVWGLGFRVYGLGPEFHPYVHLSGTHARTCSTAFVNHREITQQNCKLKTASSQKNREGDYTPLRSLRTSKK